MEHTNLTEQDNGDPATFAFTDLGTELDEERLYVTPGNVSAGGVREHQPQRPLALSFHRLIVLRFGTIATTLPLPSNDKAQLHLTQAVACGSTRATGSNVSCSALLAVCAHSGLPSAAEKDLSMLR